MKKAKKAATKRKPTPPNKMSSNDLCKSLCAIAAFHVDDSSAQKSIYDAVRRLQLLETAAVEAGMLPRS
jgi:hypothetical protein